MHWVRVRVLCVCVRVCVCIVCGCRCGAGGRRVHGACLRVEHKPPALGVPRDVGLELRREQVVACGRRARRLRPLRHLVGPVALRLQMARHVSHRPIAAEQAAASLVSRERALAQLLHQLVHVVGARQPSLCHSRRLLACSPRHTHRVVLPHPPGREVGQRKDAVACPLGRPRLQLACQGDRALRGHSGPWVGRFAPCWRAASKVRHSRILAGRRSNVLYEHLTARRVRAEVRGIYTHP